MIYFTRRSCALLASLLLALSACDSGTNSSAGIEGTGGPVAAGSVSGFGSIYVNGVRFTTDQAEVIVDGDYTAREEDLKPGMVVYIDGELNPALTEGSANRVTYQPLLRGTIDSVETLDLNTKVLTLLGQPLLVQDDIVIDGTHFGDLAAHQLIEVSGLRGGEQLLATRIELLGNGDLLGSTDLPYRVSGRISHLDTNARTFRINTLTLDYQQAETIDLPDTGLADGLLVHITANTVDDSGALIASQIQWRAADLQLEPGLRLVLEGVAADLGNGPQDSFSLNGIQIDASEASIEQGRINQLRSGTRVRVVGTAITPSLLHAESIQIILPSNTRISGTLDTVNSTTGEITLLGQPVTIDTLTAFEDRGPQPNRFINLEALAPGDRVEVFGHTRGNGQLVAKRIKRLNNQHTEITLNGLIVDVDLEFNLVYVQGLGSLVIDVSAINAELVAQLVPGLQINVTGHRLNGSNTLMATSIELFGTMASGGWTVPVPQ